MKETVKKVWGGVVKLDKTKVVHACTYPTWKVVQRVPVLAYQCLKCGWIKIGKFK